MSQTASEMLGELTGESYSKPTNQQRHHHHQERNERQMLRCDFPHCGTLYWKDQESIHIASKKHRNALFQLRVKSTLQQTNVRAQSSIRGKQGPNPIDPQLWSDISMHTSIIETVN